MTIDRIEVQVIETTLPRPFKARSVQVSTIYDVFVAVVDREGRAGLGYSTAWTEGRAALLATAVRSVADDVLGHDPHDWQSIALLGDDAYSRDDVGAGAIIQTAIGVIQLAALELAAITTDQSVSQYLGTVGHARAYLSGGPLDDTPSERATFVARAHDLGIDVLKIKIDGTDQTAAQARTTEMLERLGPSQRLAVDANQSFSAAGCREYLTALSDVRARLAWLEEPIDARNISGLADIRRGEYGIDLAAGETLFGSRSLTSLIDDGACDLLILNPTRTGGPGALLRLRDLASERRLGVLSHVNPHLSVHLISGSGMDPMVEYLPWWDSHFDPASYSLADGILATTKCTGFGFTASLRDVVLSALR